MAGINRHSQRCGKLGGTADALELLPALAVARRIGIGAGVQLDYAGAGIKSSLNLLLVGTDKQRHADAGGVQFAGKTGDFLELRQYVQTAFGSNFFALLRYDAHVIRPYRQCVGQHFFGHRHFQIDAGFDRAADGGDVVVFNVAAVFAQMQGNQVSAVGFGGQRGFQRAGIVGTARIAQGGDVVDIDAQKHGGSLWFVWWRAECRPLAAGRKAA